MMSGRFKLGVHFNINTGEFIVGSAMSKMDGCIKTDIDPTFYTNGSSNDELRKKAEQNFITNLENSRPDMRNMFRPRGVYFIKNKDKFITSDTFVYEHSAIKTSIDLDAYKKYIENSYERIDMENRWLKSVDLNQYIRKENVYYDTKTKSFGSYFEIQIINSPSGNDYVETSIDVEKFKNLIASKQSTKDIQNEWLEKFGKELMLPENKREEKPKIEDNTRFMLYDAIEDKFIKYDKRRISSSVVVTTIEEEVYLPFEDDKNFQKVLEDMYLSKRGLKDRLRHKHGIVVYDKDNDKFIITDVLSKKQNHVICGYNAREYAQSLSNERNKTAHENDYYEALNLPHKKKFLNAETVVIKPTTEVVQKLDFVKQQPQDVNLQSSSRCVSFDNVDLTFSIKNKYKLKYNEVDTGINVGLYEKLLNEGKHEDVIRLENEYLNSINKLPQRQPERKDEIKPISAINPTENVGIKPNTTGNQTQVWVPKQKPNQQQNRPAISGNDNKPGISVIGNYGTEQPQKPKEGDAGTGLLGTVDKMASKIADRVRETFKPIADKTGGNKEENSTDNIPIDLNATNLPTGEYNYGINIDITEDIKTYLKQPMISTVWQVTGKDIPKFTEVVPPGFLPARTVERISESIMKLCKSKLGSTTNKSLTNFMLTVLQSFVTFTTSRKSSPSKLHSLRIPMSDGVTLAYSEIQNCINQSVSDYDIPNPVRQYARSHSTTVIQLVTNGILEPNYKLMSKHGVPARFTPYCMDFVVPVPSLHGDEAVLANTLAKMVAMAQVDPRNETTVHNAIEFLGNRNNATGIQRLL